MTRLEDHRFLVGGGCYAADLEFSGCLEACLLRSPHAHARVVSIDTRNALASPGVRGVFTGADLEAAGVGPLPGDTSVRNRDGSALVSPSWRLLAHDTVRHVGDPVAMVVANTEWAARDAAETIQIEYEELPVRVFSPSSSGISVGERCCIEWEAGDRQAVDGAFDGAATRVSVEVVNNRIVVCPLETRCAIGQFDENPDADADADADAAGAGGRYTLYTPSQGVHFLRQLLARPVLGVAEDRLRVVTHDVGGGFGMKFGAFPEQGLVLIAAKVLGRPVRWVGTRSEAFVADAHGRDNRALAELALDEAGRFLALRVRSAANLGAYLTSYGVGTATTSFTKMVGHVYRIPAIHVQVDGWLTHTAPIDAYRGAGTPEIVYLLERLIEHAAHQIGVDRSELRRQNMVGADELPYTSPFGRTYVDGDFPAIFDKALHLAEWESFESRRQNARANGMLRGIGVAPYVKVTSGSPGESASVLLRPDGRIEVRVGTQDSGQGHATSFAQIVAERLGISPEHILVVQGDSDLLPSGAGTGGSSSLVMDAETLSNASDRFIERARALAADVLEAAVADVEFDRGWLRVVGTDHRIGLLALAEHMPAGHPCVGHAAFDGDDASYPNGAHVCEVEVDADTGVTRVVRFVAVDDIGRVWHPMIAEGQVHGGVAQGIGQALCERTVYEPETGQLLSGSWLDYCLPRADDLPEFESSWQPTSAANALGVKGIGEQGPVGAPPALMNALADALGNDSVQMPATPERVWRAMRNQGGGEK